MKWSTTLKSSMTTKIKSKIFVLSYFSLIMVVDKKIDGGL